MTPAHLRLGGLSALVLALALAGTWRPAAADNQIQADLQWGWVTFEVGTAATLATAFATERDGERVALVGGLSSVSAAIGAGLLAEYLDAPMAGANAVHGALVVGLEMTLVGAVLDHDGHAPRFGRLALGLGALGAAGGGWIGATRIPTDAYAVAWNFAPLAGFAGGVVVAAGAELFAPSSHPGRRIATIVAVAGGLALGAGWLLAEHRVGAIEPEPRTAPAPRRLFALAGRF